MTNIIHEASAILLLLHKIEDCDVNLPDSVQLHKGELFETLSDYDNHLVACEVLREFVEDEVYWSQLPDVLSLSPEAVAELYAGAIALAAGTPQEYAKSLMEYANETATEFKKDRVRKELLRLVTLIENA
jgi:vacuolar-type H+-ATPase subunit C/Vma6